jgi:hypothetical protein
MTPFLGGKTIRLVRASERLRIEITFFNPPLRKTTELSPHPPLAFETTHTERRPESPRLKPGDAWPSPLAVSPAR